MVPILRDQQFVAAIKNIKGLRKLHLQFPNIFLESGVSWYELYVPLTGIRNLTSLELYNFGADTGWIIKDLAKALSNCPDLKVLGLGRASNAIDDGSPEQIVLYGDDFLETLCREYRLLTHRLLKLHTLRLGWNICVIEEDPPHENEYDSDDSSDSAVAARSKIKEPSENFLDLLFDQHLLRTLHVCNGIVENPFSDMDYDGLKFDWAMFDDCSELDELSITRLDQQAKYWLNDIASNVRKLYFAGE